MAAEATKLKNVSSHQRHTGDQLLNTMDLRLGHGAPYAALFDCRLPAGAAGRDCGIRPGRRNRPARILDVLQPAERHRHVEFLADDFEREG